MSVHSTENAGVLPSVTPQQIDEAERLGRLFGLTYLSVEGYAKLAAVIEVVRIGIRAEPPAPPPPPPEPVREPDFPDDVAGWRVG